MGTTGKPIALVVGAANYIGAALAQRFAAGGCQVCGAQRNAFERERIKARCEEPRPMAERHPAAA